jgi:hypothetical protein
MSDLDTCSPHDGFLQLLRPREGVLVRPESGINLRDDDLQIGGSHSLVPNRGNGSPLPKQPVT